MEKESNKESHRMLSPTRKAMWKGTEVNREWERHCIVCGHEGEGGCRLSFAQVCGCLCVCVGVCVPMQAGDVMCLHYEGMLC